MKLVTIFIDCIKTDVEFRIGGNAKENIEIIDDASPQDIWFHVDGLPSEHVIAAIPDTMRLDRKQWLKLAKQGAVLCKQHSKYASQKNVQIVFTEIKNVQKTGVLGQVEISNQKILVI